MADMTIINTGIKARYQGTSVEIKTPTTAIALEVLAEIMQKTTSERIYNTIADVMLAARNSYGWLVYEQSAYKIDDYGNVGISTSIDGYLKIIAMQQAEPVEDDEELSSDDIEAIEATLNQESLGPYSMEELEAMVEQTQKPVVGSLVRLKNAIVDRTWRITRYYADGYWFVCERVGEPENPYRTRVWNVDDVEVIQPHDTATCDCNPCRATRKQQAQQAEQERVSHLAIEERFTEEEQALLDAAYERAVKLGRPFEKQEIFQPIWDAGIELSPQMDSRFILVQEATGKTARLWGVKPPQHSVNDAVTVELYGKVIAGKVVATHDPGDGYGQSVEVELVEAWRGGKKFWFEAKEVKPVTLQQAVPSHVDRYRHYHNGLATFCQAVAMIAAKDFDPFDVQGIDERIVWEKSVEMLDRWNTRESALDCGILPTEGQAVTFDMSVPY